MTDNTIDGTIEEMILDFRNLVPGSDEEYQHAQSVKMLADIRREDKKLEFEIEKEETRKLEMSNQILIDAQIRKYDMLLKILDWTQHPIKGTVEIARTKMINDNKIERDNMGYCFDSGNIQGSPTLSRALKDDKYKY